MTQPATGARGATSPDDDIATVCIDGAAPLTAETVAAVRAACDRAEDKRGDGILAVHVSGAPGERWADDLTVTLVSKWERQLRRLECLPAMTVAVVHGDCGGPALDAMLATDHRIATRQARLVVATAAGATWPGMAAYRLVVQSSSLAPVRRAVLFGTPIDTATALAAHLLDEVTADVAGALKTMVRIAAASSGPELAVRRRLLLEAGTVGFEDALGAHLAACDRMLRQVSTGAAA
jgi:isomerase DpgB